MEWTMNRHASAVWHGGISDGHGHITVQSGALKNLNVKWRNATIRRSFSTNEFDENRVFISYPISLL